MIALTCPALPSTALSEDGLLGGRVSLRQPASGFRAGIEPVLLAAAVAAEPGERVLDLGTGCGAAALCLARRCDAVEVVGIDIDADLIAVAVDNAARNGLADRVRFVVAAVGGPPAIDAPVGGFEQVMFNPPFLRAGGGRPPPDRRRERATIEDAAGLDTWIATALRMAAPRGVVTLVHRADRLADVLAALGQGAGEIVVFPLWPGQGRPAKRVLVRARRGSSAPLRVMPGLTLHRADGRFTDAAEAILRGAEPLSLRTPPADGR